MSLWRKFRIVGAAAVFCAGPAFGQGIPRVKAKITAFDGQTLSLVGAVNGDAMSVRILPTTQYVRQEKRSPGDIKINDYIGATIIKGRDGPYVAQEVHIFPEALRGTGEGLFPMGADTSRSMVDGTVDAVGAGGLSLKYRGATGGDGTACTGRAPAQGGCQGVATMAFGRGMPVLALLAADKADLVPGAVIAVSLTAAPDGHLVTLGLTIESSPPRSAPASTDAAATAPSLRPAGR